MAENVVVDDNNIPEAILGIRKALDDGMEQVYQDTISRVMGNWDGGTDALGNDWAALADSTIESKGGGDILVESGELKQDVRDTSHYDSDTRSAVFSSTLPYMGVHEFGMPERGIPARPVLSPAVKYAGRQLDTVAEEIDDNLEDAEVIG